MFSIHKLRLVSVVDIRSLQALEAEKIFSACTVGKVPFGMRLLTQPKGNNNVAVTNGETGTSRGDQQEEVQHPATPEILYYQVRRSTRTNEVASEARRRPKRKIECVVNECAWKSWTCVL
jgi:hypothetical protein